MNIPKPELLIGAVVGAAGGICASAVVVWAGRWQGSEWISFMGSIMGGFVGGSTTLVAAWVAWKSVQAQIADNAKTAQLQALKPIRFARMYLLGLLSCAEEIEKAWRPFSPEAVADAEAKKGPAELKLALRNTREAIERPRAVPDSEDMQVFLYDLPIELVTPIKQAMRREREIFDSVAEAMQTFEKADGRQFFIPMEYFGTIKPAYMRLKSDAQSAADTVDEWMLFH